MMAINHEDSTLSQKPIKIDPVLSYLWVKLTIIKLFNTLCIPGNRQHAGTL